MPCSVAAWSTNAGNPERPSLEADEYLKLLDAAAAVDWRFRVALVLAHETGHRIGSIRRLRWSDLEFREGWIRWREETDKVGREHWTPVTEAGAEALRLAETHRSDEGTRHECGMEKEAEARWQSAGEVVERLEGLATPSGGTQPVRALASKALASAARFPLRKPAFAIAVIALAVIAAAAALWRGLPAGGPSVAASFTQLTFSGNVLRAEISPDGDLLAYVEEGETTRHRGRLTHALDRAAPLAWQIMGPQEPE